MIMLKRFRILKKAVSLMLAAVLFAACCAAAAPSLAANENYPVIYVIGRTWLYKNVSTANPELMTYSTDEALSGIISKAAPYAARAIAFGAWNDYNEKTFNMLMEVYDGFALNENGEVDNDTGILWKWSENKLSKNPANNDLGTYQFEYDARLSPLEIADQLNSYVEAVKRVTGKSKVSFVGRCLGVNIIFAYLYKYQESKKFSGVNAVVLYDSSLLGVNMLDAAMSGNIQINAEALELFMQDTDRFASLSSSISGALRLMQSSYGVSISAGVGQNFYEHIKNQMVLRFFKNTYATAPGFWSMVYEHFDEAKAYIFSEPGDAQKYRNLISKINAFHSNVQERVDTIIYNMKKNGVFVADICKYGFIDYPLYEDAMQISDDTTVVRLQSLGATCSLVNNTLSDSYISSRQAAGKGDYISPDKQIDASTGALPDTTWYIKNLEHNQFPACVNPLLFDICRNRITVRTRAQYPQFMVLEGSESNYSIVPMTAENCDPGNMITDNGDSSSGNKTNLLQGFAKVVRFFSNLFNMILRLFSGKL
jgi:hypothetical protein